MFLISLIVSVLQYNKSKTNWDIYSSMLYSGQIGFSLLEWSITIYKDKYAIHNLKTKTLSKINTYLKFLKSWLVPDEWAIIYIYNWSQPSHFNLINIEKICTIWF